MTHEPDTSPVLDDDVVTALRGLRDRVRAPGEDPLAALLELFVEDSHRRLGVLRDQINRRANEDRRKTAHAIKGAAAQIGAQRVAFWAQRLENVDGDHDAAAHLAALERAVNEAIPALRARFAP